MAAAGWGLPVLAVDRNPAFLSELNGRARVSGLPLACIRADLEAPSATLPLQYGACGAVLIFRFLFRPLVPSIVRLLAPGGLLVYETFTLAQAEREGGPNNPAFMLRPGEMAELFPDLLTLSCQEDPVAACARLVARKPA
jgi:SAM-dependent methyltransferase